MRNLGSPKLEYGRAALSLRLIADAVGDLGHKDRGQCLLRESFPIEG